MTHAILQVDALEVGYRKSPLLPPLDFAVEAGELWAILGENGSGKTTLLKTLLGLIPRVSGAIEWGDEPRVGYVPQRSTIDHDIPSRVIDLIAQGLDRGTSFLDPFYAIRRRGDVEAVMRETGIAELGRSQYSELSEGQKQRVLMARALVSDPQMLVLDEPTSAMDVASEESVLVLLDELRERRNLAVILVSHQLSAAARHASHAIFVDRDSGAAVSGSIDVVATSQVCRARFGDILIDARRQALLDERQRERQREQHPNPSQPVGVRDGK